MQDVSDVLDQDNPHYEAYTMQIEVDNSPGVLNQASELPLMPLRSSHICIQVTGVFARRGYNIQSLAVGPSEKEGRSRICLVVPGDETSISKLVKQLYKLVNVQTITDMTKLPFVSRELMLVKVRLPPGVSNS